MIEDIYNSFTLVTRLSVYNFISSLIWSSIFILASVLLIRKKDFLHKYGSTIPLLLLGMGLFRLLFVAEFPFTVVVHSHTILPAFINFMRQEVLIRDRTITLSVMFGTILITVGMIKLLGLVVRHIHQRNKLSSIQSVQSPRATAVLHKVVNSDRPGQKYDLIISEDIPTPMISGYFKPVFYLPDIYFTDDELELVLKHEWHHFVHKDLWLRLLVDIVSAILWWNPLVYIFPDDLIHLQEIANDLKVTSSLSAEGRVKYLSSILNVVKHSKAAGKAVSNSAALMNVSAEDQLKQRFHLVLNRPEKLTKRVTVFAIIAIVLLFVLSNSFIIQPAGGPPPIEGEVYVGPENAYLVSCDDGTYDVYIYGEFVHNIPESYLKDEPYKSMDIVTQ